jgi:hypothetical protein
MTCRVVRKMAQGLSACAVSTGKHETTKIEKAKKKSKNLSVNSQASYFCFDRRSRIARGTTRYLARDCGLNEIVIVSGFFAAFAPASNWRNAVMTFRVRRFRGPARVHSSLSEMCPKPLFTIKVDIRFSDQRRLSLFVGVTF